MAEGRMLRRTISRDERVSQLSAHSALLYVFSIPHLDRDGRMDGLPVAVRGIVVPYIAQRHPDEWTDQQVEKYMTEWTTTTDKGGQARPLVLWYCVRGVWACEFPGFALNQSIIYAREAASRFPAPPDDLLSSLTSRAVAARDAVPDSEALLRASLKSRSQVAAHRARKLKVEIEDVDYYVVADNHKWTCHICARAITLFSGTHATSLSFDHIIPMSRGGAHTYANIAPAHFGCNGGKCDRVSVTPALSLSPILGVSSDIEIATEAEAEVQGQEPAGQRHTVARAREAALAALPEDFSDRTSSDKALSFGDDELGREVVAGVERRLKALASHGPLARLLEVLPDMDGNTPRVLHALYDPLGPAAIEHARAEILAGFDEIRSPSAYAQGIARRLARGERRDGKRRGVRRFLTPEDERREVLRAELEPGI